MSLILLQEITLPQAAYDELKELVVEWNLGDVTKQAALSSRAAKLMASSPQYSEIQNYKLELDVDTKGRLQATLMSGPITACIEITPTTSTIAKD